jgi:ABC-2 type transport system ATP-binding protein
VILVCEDSTAGDRFRAIPQVQSVNIEGLQLTIRGVGSDLVTNVIQCLAEHRMRVSDFRTELPTLEDVFLELTGHMIRE